MQILRPVRASRLDSLGIAFAMISVAILTMFGDISPRPVLIAVTVMALTWTGLHFVKRWWKRGDEKFREIMEKELDR